MRLRPATEADRDRLLEWRNDPEARAASRNTDEVSPAEHAAWLEGVLADPDRHLLIAEIDGEPCGQVRFDRRRGYRYEISVSLAATARGAGSGAELIETGCAWLWRHTSASDVEAWVRHGNAASARAFEVAGFRDSGEAEDGLRRLDLSRPEPWAPWEPRARELEARLSS